MDKKSITIPVYLINTLSPKGYFNRFYELIDSSGLSQVDAFRTIELERELFSLPSGYDNYNSFKRCKNYHYNRGLFRLLE